MICILNLLFNYHDDSGLSNDVRVHTSKVARSDFEG